MTTSFGALGVPASLVDVLAGLGITTPTPIQAATLPDSLAGRDVLGRGRTGSGKTFAFLLPLVARLTATPRRAQPGRPRALILVPTRELASQVEESLQPLAKVTGLTSRTVFGGVNQNPQVSALKRGVDVVVACPGRLEDLMKQGHVSLAGIEVTILDEADHMADLGFLPVVRRLLDTTPTKGQRMLFSATLDAAVNKIVERYLHDAVVHEADSPQSPVATMSHHVLHVTAADRVAVLTDLVAAPGRTVVFTRTKHGARKLAKQFNAAGVPAVELHGNLSQNARVRTMDAFHGGQVQTLVATDIAARGIHVDDVGLVIHADPPVEHKAYLHRSGRTARAGAAGTVVTLMTDDQVKDVRDLTRKAGVKPTVTRVTPTSELLQKLAPGQRSFPGGVVKEQSQPQGPSRNAGQASRRRRPAGDNQSAGQPGQRREGARAGESRRSRPAAGSPSRGGAPASPSRGGAAATVSRGGAAAFSANAGGRRRSR